MGVDVVGEGAGRGGPEVWEEFVLGVEGDDRKGELLGDGSGRGGRGDDGDRGFNDGGWEVFDWDVRERDTVNDFLELEVDPGLRWRGGTGAVGLEYKPVGRRCRRGRGGNLAGCRYD